MSILVEDNILLKSNMPQLRNKRLSELQLTLVCVRVCAEVCGEREREMETTRM